MGEIIAESEEAKRKRAKRIEELTASGWKEMNLAANDYVFERTMVENSYLFFKDRDATVLGLFRTFGGVVYDEGLIEKIRGEKPWNYKADRELSVENLSNKVIYQFLAIVVHITGRRKKITLIKDLKEALAHFPKKEGHYGEDMMKKLLSSFLITEDLLPDLSANFRSVVQSYGQHLSGDEKIFKYTGHSADVRKVPSKPDKIGLWFYELAGPLDNKTSFLLDQLIEDQLIRLRSVDRELLLELL